MQVHIANTQLCIIIVYKMMHFRLISIRIATAWPLKALQHLPKQNTFMHATKYMNKMYSLDLTRTGVL